MAPKMDRARVRSWPTGYLMAMRARAVGIWALFVVGACSFQMVKKRQHEEEETEASVCERYARRNHSIFSLFSVWYKQKKKKIILPAAPMPWSAREIHNMTGDREKPLTVDQRQNQARPAKKMRRWPKRSPWETWKMKMGVSIWA